MPVFVCVCAGGWVSSYVDLTGYSAIMGTVYRDPKEGEPGIQSIALNKIVCGPSESHLVLLQLETYCSVLCCFFFQYLMDKLFLNMLLSHASLFFPLFVLLVLQSLMSVCHKYVFPLSATLFQREPSVRLLDGGKPKVEHHAIFPNLPRILKYTLSFSLFNYDLSLSCLLSVYMCILGTGDETVLNVAQMQVQSNSECNKYFKGRVKQNEMCTTTFYAGVGACEVSFVISLKTH